MDDDHGSDDQLQRPEASEDVCESALLTQAECAENDSTATATATATGIHGSAEIASDKVPTNANAKANGAVFAPLVETGTTESSQAAMAIHGAPMESSLLESTELGVLDSDEGASSDGSDSFDEDDSASTISESNSPFMSLTEKRNRNMQRHRDVLDRLGMAHGIKAMSTVTTERQGLNTTHDDAQTNVNANGPQHRYHLPQGMLLFTGGILQHRSALRARTTPMSKPSSSPSSPRDPALMTDNHIDNNTNDDGSSLSLTELCDTYPYREEVIRKLSDLLSVPLTNDSVVDPNGPGMSVAATTTAPPPIFITGPAGSGKTAIVLDVLQHVIHHRSSRSKCFPSDNGVMAAHAYIDCLALDAPTLEEFVSDVYGQFAKQFKDMSTSKRRKGRVKMVPSHRAPACAIDSDPTHQTTTADVESSVAPQQQRRKTLRASVQIQQSTTPNGKGRRHESSAYLQSHDDRNDAPSSVEQQRMATNSPLVAVWGLGCALERWLSVRRQQRNGVHGRPYSPPSAAYLVIDNAERLMSFNASSSRQRTAADTTNFLAQLLLLPRTLQLNLTVIVITKSVLLEHCSLNTVSARGTVVGNINPLRVHFAAYQGKQAIQTILCTKSVRTLILGNDWDESDFYDVVVRSFLKTLVSLMYDLTRDIKEYIRLGRALWPIYVQPVLPENVEGTIRNLSPMSGSGKARTKSDVQRELLCVLDQRIAPYMRHALEHGVAALVFDSPPGGLPKRLDSRGDQTAIPSDIPHLAKFLLLAVYVCQVNRPDKDRELFSIQTNGKRKRGEQAEETGEDIAFGSAGAGQASKAYLRPRAFPLERLYSLYVSIVGLNSSPITTTAPGFNHEEMLRSLGNVAFHETVAYLRDIDVLHDYPKRMAASDPIRIGQRSFWSSLTRDEATEIAKSIDFPLERYIL